MIFTNVGGVILTPSIQIFLCLLAFACCRRSLWKDDNHWHPNSEVEQKLEFNVLFAPVSFTNSPFSDGCNNCLDDIIADAQRQFRVSSWGRQRM